ncbi:MAG: hypothetical protein IJK89_06225 [Clostridia bacterium]|nr:hypothetical protein [Clostridia bacterium]
MNDYSYRDIMRMQEEAKARVMEMRRRSRFLAEDFAGGEARTESGVRRAEMQEEPQEYRARAIRMPVELPERGEARAESGERREARAESGERRAEIRQGTGLTAALRNVFGNMGEEETEKMFLLSLCLLLSQENGDEGLLLAMMYLLT